MMRRLLILLLLSFFFVGCAQNNQTAGNGASNGAGNGANSGGENQAGNGGYDENYTYVPEIYFSAYPPEGVIGVQYDYWFCEPAPENANGVCAPLEDSLAPSGGHYPYHFTLESGTGFQPMGLSLQPNGLLTGIPTTAGTSEFSVCAIDLDAKQKCANVSITIKKPIELKLHFTGGGRGKVSIYGGTKNITCAQDCTVPFEGGFSTAALVFQPDQGSAFGGWSGACTGTSPCQPIMNEDKDATANFEKFGIQVASATCAYVPHGGYDYQIRVSGTASGPAGTYLSMDMAHYNGFLDAFTDCGAWSEKGNGAYCTNDGKTTAIQWAQGFNMGSPREDRTHPFDYQPSMILSAGYGENTFYSSPDLKDPEGDRIVVPLNIHCN